MTSSRLRQRILLGSVIIASAALWGFVLPYFAQLPAMRGKIERLHQLGIDSGAMFYSDHPSAFSDGAAQKANQ